MYRFLVEVELCIGLWRMSHCVEAIVDHPHGSAVYVESERAEGDDFELAFRRVLKKRFRGGF